MIMVSEDKQKARRKATPRKKKTGGGAQAYESLKALIISGEFSPGSDLDEGELVKLFSVSRTPVREALIRLSVEGLVTMKPSRGAKVSNLNFSDIADHLEIMDILTPSICYLVALRRTPSDLETIKTHVNELNANRQSDLTGRLDSMFKLHTTLGAATHNQSLAEIYRLATYAKIRIGKLSAERTETKAEWKAHKTELQNVYQKIYDSIAKRDALGAQKAGSQWTSVIRKRLSSMMSSAPTQDLKIKL